MTNIGPLAAKYGDASFSDLEAYLLGYGPSDLKLLVERKVLFSEDKRNTSAPPQVVARADRFVYHFR